VAEGCTRSAQGVACGSDLRTRIAHVPSLEAVIADDHHKADRVAFGDQTGLSGPPSGADEAWRWLPPRWLSGAMMRVSETADRSGARLWQRGVREARKESPAGRIRVRESRTFPRWKPSSPTTTTKPIESPSATRPACPVRPPGERGMQNEAGGRAERGRRPGVTRQMSRPDEPGEPGVSTDVPAVTSRPPRAAAERKARPKGGPPLDPCPARRPGGDDAAPLSCDEL
jgi:hypothetical protein